MNMQQTCDPNRLDAFVRGELSEHQESELTAHLDQCASCGEELERRVAALDQWREAGELLTHRKRRPNVMDLANDPSANGSLATSTIFAEQMDQVVGMLSPTDDPEMLGRIGGYEVSGVIGCGGMGVVFKAHDRSLDRVVAVKVMAPHLAGSGAARKRFARESKAAAAVLHPNVIAIHCVADDPKLPYLVMPYIGGASLQKRVEADGPLSTQDTLRIGQQIAAGLAAAHAQGLVHRDIKPANILLERGVERVTITDFGLARAVDDATMTRSGVIAGTPQYMSPEQARGESIDHRSDLFSLGSVLYMMCAGHSPFRAETTFGILRRITDNQPRPLREINPDVPDWLCAIIEKLHAKEPSDRFQSAEEVAQLLEGCLAHVQQPATTPLPTSGEQLSQLLPEATTAPQPAKKQLRQLCNNLPPIGKYIAAAAGAFALFFAGILIVLELDKGTLTIESELDSVPIRIMQGDAVVDRLTVTKSGNSVRVAAGSYVVELDTELDGMVVENDQVSLKRGAKEQVKIRYAKTLNDAKDGSPTVRFETPEALMKHAADCQTKDDGPGFMDCWTDQAFKDFVPSYLLTSIMQLQYSENSSDDKPKHPELIVELKQILTEEFGSSEAGKALLALALAHKEIADRSADKFTEAAEATAESPLVQLLASGSAELINARSFIMKLSALHKKYEEPKAKKEPRVFAYTVEQNGDKAVATETTGKNKFGLIKTETGWRINDVFYGLKAKAESASLQGEWEFISAESDGVIREYKTLKTQPSMARLTIAGDMWTVKAGDGTNGMGSGGHRVAIDGNKLTFHGITTMLPGLGSNEEIPTIGYGLWKVYGDTLTYLMTPAVAESALNGQSEPPIHFPDSFETKGTENNVFRLRRIHPSTPPTSSSSTNISSTKSSPEYPPVKILVHDEEGKPLEGVKVSLFQLAKDQGGQVLEINETSNASGIAVDRNLPYGHYELSAKTSDGWYLPGYGSRLKVEFEKGLSLKLVVPAPTPFGRLTIRDDAKLRLAASDGLRFGILEEVNGPGFWVSPAPEPDGDLGAYDSFPTVTNGIEQVGIEIRFEMAKNISQPSPSGTHLNLKWKWTPIDKAKSSCRYLIVDGKTRAFVNQSVSLDNPFHGLPLEEYERFKLPSAKHREECELFKLPSAKHRVGGSLIALREPTDMPLEIEIPAGEVGIYVERILGKPSLAAMKALKWEPHEDQPELWLAADIQRNSAWLERLIDTSAWIRTNLKPGHLQIRKLIRAGETLEVSLAPKPVDQKTSSVFAARTLDDITSVYNDQTLQAITPLKTGTAGTSADSNEPATAQSISKSGLFAVPESHMQVFFSQPLKARVILTKGDDRELVLPTRVNMPFGDTHYFELSDIPGYTGIKLSGSIELKNVSKQAEGYLKQNAVPIDITKDDIERCLKNDVVIKAIYVPNPTTQGAEFGAPKVVDSPLKTDGELCEEAERLGAMMAVLRIYKSIAVVIPRDAANEDSNRVSTTEELLKSFQGHPKATDSFKRVFEVAEDSARKDGKPLNSMYLLAALLTEGSALAIKEVADQKNVSMRDLIRRCNDAARVADRLFKATPDGEAGIPQTTSAEHWTQLAATAEFTAKQWKNDYLGTEHLLMALIADRTVTNRFLREQGIEAAAVRDMQMRISHSPRR